jgi:hypothetical protein
LDSDSPPLLGLPRGAIPSLLVTGVLLGTGMVLAATGLLWLRDGWTAILTFMPIMTPVAYLIALVGVGLGLSNRTVTSLELGPDGISFPAKWLQPVRFHRWADVLPPTREGLDGRLGLYWLTFGPPGSSPDAVELTVGQTRQILADPRCPSWPVPPSIRKALAR